MPSLLQPFLLLLIHERPDHGYDLMERLGGLGVTDVEPGQVYRALRALERQRSVRSVWMTTGAGPARRQYRLTAAGLASLEGWMERLSRLHAVLGGCLGLWAKTQPSLSAGARRSAQPGRQSAQAGRRPGGPPAPPGGAGGRRAARPAAARAGRGAQAGAVTSARS